MPLTAEAYLRETFHAMQDRYLDDCVMHACRIAQLLLDEGRAPWIAILRKREVLPNGDVFHAPLIPERFDETWTTHYVACAGSLVFDPLLEAPIAIDEYASAVFGKPGTLETHLDAAETERLLISGEIRRSFGKAVYPSQCLRTTPPDGGG